MNVVSNTLEPVVARGGKEYGRGKSEYWVEEISGELVAEVDESEREDYGQMFFTGLPCRLFLPGKTTCDRCLNLVDSWLNASPDMVDPDLKGVNVKSWRVTKAEGLRLTLEVKEFQAAREGWGPEEEGDLEDDDAQDPARCWDYNLDEDEERESKTEDLAACG